MKHGLLPVNTTSSSSIPPNTRPDEDAEGSDDYEYSSDSDSSEEYEEEQPVAGPSTITLDRPDRQPQDDVNVEDARVEAAIEGDFELEVVLELLDQTGFDQGHRGGIHARFGLLRSSAGVLV